MGRCFWILQYLVIVYLCKEGWTQHDFPPVTLKIADRKFKLGYKWPKGTLVYRATIGDDPFGRNITYGLEPKISPSETFDPVPLDINPETGEIFVNDTLTDKVNMTIPVYVSADDGKLPSKVEVIVEIVNGSQPFRLSPSPSFLGFPGQHPGRPPPPPPDFFNTNTQPRPPPKLTPLSKIPTTLPSTQSPLPAVPSTRTSQPSLTPERPAETSTEFPGTVTKDTLSVHEQIVIVIGVALLAVVVGCAIIGALMRNKIRSTLRSSLKKRSAKDPMEMKESSASTISALSRASIDSPMAMQQWCGPRAFSNRYEGWQQDTHISSTFDDEKFAEVAANDPWEVSRSRLRMSGVLGEGCFGQVWRGEINDFRGVRGRTIVAVKTLKKNAGEKERADLLQELAVMKTLEPHDNVVRLVGCCTISDIEETQSKRRGRQANVHQCMYDCLPFNQLAVNMAHKQCQKEPIYVIMEYVALGKLQSFLRNSRAERERQYNNLHGASGSLTSRELTTFLQQIARGMVYLSAHGIVHRDLAARNVLLTEDRVCKVADFGFARDIGDNLVYERKTEGRLPIRWMAPESLYDNVFSVKSDVWSFGVLMWEVVTLGSTPYPGMAAAAVLKRVRDGYRLDKPDHCRRELYQIMYYCWHQDPEKRPDFPEVVKLLEGLLSSETDYIELDNFPDHSYYNMVSLSGEKL